LKGVNKNENEIKEEWRDKAVERVKAELILIKIAEKEKIEPDVEEVEKEANHLMQHYKDVDPLRARIYVYTQIRNHKVFEFLEK
jgi:FKBP-type peptidyl-prolyl cis-trans isomerase (trigger factor)